MKKTKKQKKTKKKRKNTKRRRRKSKYPIILQMKKKYRKTNQAKNPTFTTN